ncbi:LamG domain-containing protein [Syntrophus sp. (in: bacteria)]|uniref:LamG domain-containing protein n=1 Tax=Syntrophus sp. (in: bacteria) TaxID=48412 RepID=UPI00345EC0CF
MKRRRFSELLTLIKRIKGRMAAFAVFAVFPVLAFNAPAYAVLVGSYAFEEGSGTIIQDASGRGNNGALVNGKETSWTTGHSGLGLYFPGVTGSGSTHVNLGNPADFQLSNALTFTAWVYSENPNSDAPILAKEGNGVLSYWFGVFHNQFGVLLDHTGNYAWDLERRNVGTVPAKEWHHLAATWDGSVVHYFFDGVQLAESANYSHTLFNGNANLTIGVNSDFNFTAFQGTLDDIHIYNNALNADQIKADMNPVPIPGAAWLLGSGLLGLMGLKRRVLG